jgi:rubrerythrin
MILNNIREDIKGELEAVILYEEELPLLPHSDIRKVLSSIIMEEKGHSEHLTRLLLKYDPIYTIRWTEARSSNRRLKERKNRRSVLIACFSLSHQRMSLT